MLESIGHVFTELSALVYFQTYSAVILQKVSECFDAVGCFRLFHMVRQGKAKLCFSGVACTLVQFHDVVIFVVYRSCQHSMRVVVAY